MIGLNCIYYCGTGDYLKLSGFVTSNTVPVKYKSTLAWWMWHMIFHEFVIRCWLCLQSPKYLGKAGKPPSIMSQLHGLLAMSAFSLACLSVFIDIEVDSPERNDPKQNIAEPEASFMDLLQKSHIISCKISYWSYRSLREGN